MEVSLSIFFRAKRWKGGPVGGHFDRDVPGFARWTKSFMKKARRRDWPVYIIDFISFFFEDVRERHATEILEIKEYIYIYLRCERNKNRNIRIILRIIIFK